MSVILFLLVLFVLILVHEWGHFIVAKKTNMRVEEFGIGFPPRLLKKRFGETLYTLNALPIGGFVRIWGENYEEKRGQEIPEGYDPKRAFSARPKWAQALVLIAGVTMNILFAWFLFSLTFMIGTPTAVEEINASAEAKLYIGSSLPNTPAEAIPPGSEILSIQNSKESLDVLVPSEMIAFVESSGAEPLLIQYQYGNEVSEVEITPELGANPNNPEVYAVGAGIALVDNISLPPHTALYQGFIQTGQGLVAISVGLFTLLKESFVGTADYSQIAGPIGIVGLVGDAAEFGFTALLTFTAIISLNLAIINLLPFPALDGGRLVFVAIETVTGRPIPPEWTGRMNLIGFALLMILMIAVTYNDIARLL